METVMSGETSMSKRKGATRVSEPLWKDLQQCRNDLLPLSFSASDWLLPIVLLFCLTPGSCESSSQALIYDIP